MIIITFGIELSHSILEFMSFDLQFGIVGKDDVPRYIRIQEAEDSSGMASLLRLALLFRATRSQEVAHSHSGPSN